eukprot:455826-Alexandrium_andersonii.AAC.1
MCLLGCWGGAAPPSEERRSSQASVPGVRGAALRAAPPASRSKLWGRSAPRSASGGAPTFTDSDR